MGFLWTKVLGLPLGESRWEPKDFAKKQYIFASHPHGVGSWHHIGPMLLPATCMAGRAFGDLSPVTGGGSGGRRDLAAGVLFRIPILRDLALAAGAVDASRRVASRLLSGGLSRGQGLTPGGKEKESKKEGASLGILVGGEQEQLISQRGNHTAFVLGRKGFVRLALRHGVELVPCYCFGETDLYHQSTALLKQRCATAPQAPRTWKWRATFAPSSSLRVCVD